jgi:hypothetical protein
MAKSYPHDSHRLAVDYLFLSDGGHSEHPKLDLEHFNAATEQNDYEVSSAYDPLNHEELPLSIFLIYLSMKPHAHP